MAFDVVSPLDTNIADDFDVSIFSADLAAADSSLSTPPNSAVHRVRQLALFEGRDDRNRVHPLLGTAEPARDMNGFLIDWPKDTMYTAVNLTGPMQGAIAWHSPTTEVPGLGDVEDHVHLVHFVLINRKKIKYDSNADERGLIPIGSIPAGDGTYLVRRPVVQHNGKYGSGYDVKNPTTYADEIDLNALPEFVDQQFPQDLVTARPGEVTTVRMLFDRPGNYVWHCHILSHEDHEMMRIFQVRPRSCNGKQCK